MPLAKTANMHCIAVQNIPPGAVGRTVRYTLLSHAINELPRNIRKHVWRDALVRPEYLKRLYQLILLPGAKFSMKSFIFEFVMDVEWKPIDKTELSA